MEKGFSDEVACFIKRVEARRKRVLLICDENISLIYEGLIKSFKFEKLVLPASEKTKSRETKEFIEDFLFSHGYKRNTELIAFGGGVILDLVGFVAATFMRGVTLSMIPTSITAFCDASIGGKNGINTEFGKNLLGTFYLPEDVCLDESFLKTLPKQEYEDQFSEVVKISMTSDRELFFRPQKSLMRARKLKEDICNQDMKEKGIREILNFGHTFAHAYERVTDYKVSHGKAVWMGIYFESILSVKLGILSQKEFKFIQASVPSFELDVPIESLIDAMKNDKKNKCENPYFVLLEEIGKVYHREKKYSHPVDCKIVLECLNELKKEATCAS